MLSRLTRLKLEHSCLTEIDGLKYTGEQIRKQVPPAPGWLGWLGSKKPDSDQVLAHHGHGANLKRTDLD